MAATTQQEQDELITLSVVARIDQCWCIPTLAKMIRQDEGRENVSLPAAVERARAMVRDDSTLCPH